MRVVASRIQGITVEIGGDTTKTGAGFGGFAKDWGRRGEAAGCGFGD